MSKYTQTSIFGRDSMLLAVLIITLVGLLVWGHHLFVVGFDNVTLSYFTTATNIIAVPTLIKLFNWCATIWTSCFYYNSIMLFVFGFLFSFSVGGITGLTLANSLINTNIHDTYSVIAHFHHVLSIGTTSLLTSIMMNEWVDCASLVYSKVQLLSSL